MKYMVSVDSEINYDEIEDKEFCPYCGASGCLMDM